MDKKTPPTKTQQSELLRRYLDNMLENEETVDADLTMKCINKIIELEGIKLPSKRVIRKNQRELFKKMRQAEKEYFDRINNQ